MKVLRHSITVIDLTSDYVHHHCFKGNSLRYTQIDLAFPVGTPTFLTSTSNAIMVINVVVLHSPVSRNVSRDCILK